MARRFRFLTYNIRKGKGASGRLNGSVDNLSRALAEQAPDLMFCQEVFHGTTRQLHQSNTLAEGLGLSPYYQPNRKRRVGHYGNATFCRFPAGGLVNHNISTNPIEKRGVLYLRAELEGRAVHLFNAHLGLNQRQRSLQIRQIDRLIATTCHPADAVLLGGDFNDWNRVIDRFVVEKMQLTNAFAHMRGKDGLTWHARRPVFNLDRVYVRNLKATDARRLAGGPWNELSDHYPLCVELELA